MPSGNSERNLYIDEILPDWIGVAKHDCVRLLAVTAVGDRLSDRTASHQIEQSESKSSCSHRDNPRDPG